MESAISGAFFICRSLNYCPPLPHAARGVCLIFIPLAFVWAIFHIYINITRQIDSLSHVFHYSHAPAPVPLTAKFFVLFPYFRIPNDGPYRFQRYRHPSNHFKDKQGRASHVFSRNMIYFLYTPGVLKISDRNCCISHTPGVVRISDHSVLPSDQPLTCTDRHLWRTVQNVSVLHW